MFDEPVPEPDAVLKNVIKNESDEPPEPLAVAVLGAICNPTEVSEP